MRRSRHKRPPGDASPEPKAAQPSPRGAASNSRPTPKKKTKSGSLHAVVERDAALAERKKATQKGGEETVEGDACVCLLCKCSPKESRIQSRVCARRLCTHAFMLVVLVQVCLGFGPCISCREDGNAWADSKKKVTAGATRQIPVGDACKRCHDLWFDHFKQWRPWSSFCDGVHKDDDTKQHHGQALGVAKNPLPIEPQRVESTTSTTTKIQRAWVLMTAAEVRKHLDLKRIPKHPMVPKIAHAADDGSDESVEYFCFVDDGTCPANAFRRLVVETTIENNLITEVSKPSQHVWVNEARTHHMKSISEARAESGVERLLKGGASVSFVDYREQLEQKGVLRTCATDSEEDPMVAVLDADEADDDGDADSQAGATNIRLARTRSSMTLDESAPGEDDEALDPGFVALFETLSFELGSSQQPACEFVSVTRVFVLTVQCVVRSWTGRQRVDRYMLRMKLCEILINGLDGRTRKGALRLIEYLLADPATRSEGRRLQDYMEFVTFAEKLHHGVENIPSADLTRMFTAMRPALTDIPAIMQRGILLRHVQELKGEKKYASIQDMLDLWANGESFDVRRPKLADVGLDEQQKTLVYGSVCIKTVFCGLLAEGETSLDTVRTFSKRGMEIANAVDFVELDAHRAEALSWSLDAYSAVWALATPEANVKEFEEWAWVNRHTRILSVSIITQC